MLKRGGARKSSASQFDINLNSILFGIVSFHLMKITIRNIFHSRKHVDRHLKCVFARAKIMFKVQKKGTDDSIIASKVSVSTLTTKRFHILNMLNNIKCCCAVVTSNLSPLLRIYKHPAQAGTSRTIALSPTTYEYLIYTCIN